MVNEASAQWLDLRKQVHKNEQISLKTEITKNDYERKKFETGTRT